MFRPEELPDAGGFVDRWQAMARQAGLEGLYLVAEASDLLGRGPVTRMPKADGFDASVYMRLPVEVNRGLAPFAMRVARKTLRGPEIWPYSDRIVAVDTRADPALSAMRLSELGQHSAGGSTWPRRDRRDAEALSAQRRRRRSRCSRDRPPQERLLWVKSWNEWAEGNHLEPDLA